jgi:succinyl-diaminopimelate desuccinylase
MNVIELSKKLISFPSVTPDEAGCLGYIEQLLKDNGFACERHKFAEVDNLYARRGTGKNFCFAGHIDVVPPGDVKNWKSDPYKPEIRDGVLYGRGASDMKAAIAASLLAGINYKGQGAISFLITADEEGPGINGTKKVLEILDARGEKIDACVVGEPTNPEKLGEMIKIGRRGSMNCTITVHGKQGHAAYPHNADNPVKKLIKILPALQNHKLDAGTEHFSPSNLEVVTFDVGNPASNVIPAKASAVFNIRFNNLHSSEALKKWIESVAVGAELKFHVSGESFLTKPARLSEVAIAAVKEVTGMTPELSTTGGTSDARFIANYAEVVEFGLINKSAHQVDENARVDEIEALEKVYSLMLDKFFK